MTVVILCGVYGSVVGLRMSSNTSRSLFQQKPLDLSHVHGQGGLTGQALRLAMLLLKLLSCLNIRIIIIISIDITLSIY